MARMKIQGTPIPKMEDVQIIDGKYYYQGERVTSRRWIQRYNREHGLTRKYNKKAGYESSRKLSTKQGSLKSWQNAYSKTNVSPIKGIPRFDSQGQPLFGTEKIKGRARWGVDINKNVTSKNALTFATWADHLFTAAHQLTTQAERFRMAALHKALSTFEESFRYQKFRTAQSPKWRSLAPSTRNKRLKRKRKMGNIMAILNEYGDLAKSLELNSSEHTITTKEIPADISKYKYRNQTYAGFHNEGIPGRLTKRQFMGHSSYLDPMTNTTMSMMVKQYLFDSVFMVRL